MQNLWNTEDQKLLERLNKDILSGPALSRLDPYKRFYIKTSLSKDVMEVVILQKYDSAAARESAVK